MSRRRSFRRMPQERLSSDYYSPDPSAPDKTYSSMAAVIEGYEFDRVGFRVSGKSFRSADMVHWLALDVASRALTDAGFEHGRGLPKDSTGVVLGNTLAGEFSRANVMRLRWPYVRRVVAAQMAEEGIAEAQRREFLQKLERSYKSPFPEVTEETLAGGMSNTIAGRVCNHFDLHGGGYAMDGACSSSLLAVANACSALCLGDLDVALAGGVDLSLDPFELVGFAKTSALNAGEMKVFDESSNGFWPGEGCGIAVLMRAEDALEQGRPIYAVIRGWGMSSDGQGGLTRPEVSGQRLALDRAYKRAGYGIDTVAFFEGHGTGTRVGDAVELEVLSSARREADPKAPQAAVGSIKANIGHTKAAAGIAALIKATLAVKNQVLPPTTGCNRPHPKLNGEQPMLRPLPQAMPWPMDQELRAGASSMGFGGINLHVTVSGECDDFRRTKLGRREAALSRSWQDAELFLLSADSREELRSEAERVRLRVLGLSLSDLTDLSHLLSKRDKGRRWRAAVVASRPTELAAGLERLAAALEQEEDEGRLDLGKGVFLSKVRQRPRIGLLFPGQGAPLHRDGGSWRQRFQEVDRLYDSVELPAPSRDHDTAAAQPSVAAASIAALAVLRRFGIRGEVAVGHSLGELTAYHWAGVLDEASLLRVAKARGRSMAEHGDPNGAMAGIRATGPQVEPLLEGTGVVIAGLNSPSQTVVSGLRRGIETVKRRAERQGLQATLLPVSHAFHSPLVADCQPDLEGSLSQERFEFLQKRVLSTISGKELGPQADLRELLCRQLTLPVRFQEAVEQVGRDVDLWIEAGPGGILSGLAGEFSSIPALALDACGSSSRGLMLALGACYALGVDGIASMLFKERFSRPFDLDDTPRFFANPCDAHRSAHTATDDSDTDTAPLEALETAAPAEPLPPADPQDSALGVLTSLVANQAELPESAIQPDSRLLSDLHLNSIAVGQLMSEAARSMGLEAPMAPTEFADSELREAAQALEDLRKAGSSDGGSGKQERQPAGIVPWTRAFRVELTPAPLRSAAPNPSTGESSWQIFAPNQDPLAAALTDSLKDTPGKGVVLCLPAWNRDRAERHLHLFVDAGRAALNLPKSGKVALVQPGGGSGSWARTLHQERSLEAVCVIDLPAQDEAAAEKVKSELISSHGYVEAVYDSESGRRQPILRHLPLEERTTPKRLEALGTDDLLLVTGGGKGIAAECALELARICGCRLLLLGRSDPQADEELNENLQRLEQAGLSWRYRRADVSDATQLRAAVAAAAQDWGPVTAVLHGAGANRPKLLSELEEEDFRRTIGVKVDGLRHLLAALDGDKLRLLVTFGSIIARIGLPGEADYGLANEWLDRLVADWKARHDHCRCLNIEWSVWSGVGMGQRLGRIESLAHQGVTAIPPDEGVDWLLRLIGGESTGESVVVTGRYGDPQTLRMEEPELPFLRFLERPRVHYPGIELVVEAELTASNDPYLLDHRFEGRCVFPAAVGIEAMAQVADALLGSAGAEAMAFEEVRFERPVIVPDEGATTIRLAACVKAPGCVEVALRSEETSYQLDHFRAVVRSLPRPDGEGGDPAATREWLPPIRSEGPSVPIRPESDLYDRVLFQRGRFQRISGYRLLRARQCVAELAGGNGESWFGRFLPGETVIGDPGLRDAAIHSIQSCIPHSALLPTGVESIRILRPSRGGEEPSLLARAKERKQEGDRFVYDLELCDDEGRTVEIWQGLGLKRVGRPLPAEELAAPLLGPYIERRLGELTPGASVAVALERNGAGGPRRASSDAAMRRALGKNAPVRRRSDGKPVTGNGAHVSASHSGDLVMAVAGYSPVSCDIESVEERPSQAWRDLLGHDGFALSELISRETDESLDASATRVWAASECLKKAGLAYEQGLTLVSSREDSVLLSAGSGFRIATFNSSWQKSAKPGTVAVLLEQPS